MEGTDTLLGILRIIGGFIFLLFLPGYALTLALYPKKDELSLLQRLAYSCLLSICAVILSVLFIDIILGIRTTATNIVIILMSLIFLCLILWQIELFFIRKNFIPRIYESLIRFEKVISEKLMRIKVKFKGNQ